jgi:tetratricopeptide (TPR) repeat protein
LILEAWGVRMSKKKSKPPARAAARGVPGAVGGPSTGRGMNYQIDYAVLKAIDLIARYLCAPHKGWAIRIEPRAGRHAAATQWDLGIDPPGSLVEAKLNPTRADILDWLGRLALAASSPGGQFVLVYSKGGGTLLQSLEKLIRNAREAAGDAQKFTDLLSMENIPEASLLLGKIGIAPHLALARAEIKFLPEAVLEESTQERARFLASVAGTTRLLDLLFHKFSKAVPNRVTFPVRELVDEIKGQGIPLNAPPTVDPADLPRPAAASLVMLQACPAGVPLEVMACATSHPADELREQLNALEKEEVLTARGDVWSVRPLPAKVNLEGAQDVLARALEALLGYVAAHKHESGGLGQVRNVIALGKLCVVSHPAVVQKAYKPLEKALKRKGDKHLVLEVAGLVVEAARRSGRADDEVRAEAHALICGQSWVYQRIDRLVEARAFAEKSLELGERVRWDRNTAFCKKCIGRLQRMEAEKRVLGPERDRLLAESVASLQDALQRFRAHGEFGPSHPEVGECHSLLGRTHLAAGRIADAKVCVEAASALLLDPNAKDYMDLAILKGDLAAAEGDRERADEWYQQALGVVEPGDAERSEIQARALYRRGLNRAAGGQTGAAIHDLEEASDIWRALGEHRAAAAPAWEAIRLSTPLPGALGQILEPEPLPVRVAAVEIYKKKLSACGEKPPQALANPPPESCAQIIAEAKEWVAINVIAW